MINYLRKVFFILDVNTKQISTIFLVIISASLSEAFGIRLVYPFIILISQENNIEQINNFQWILQILPENNVILFMGIILVTVFIINIGLYLLSQKFLITFYNQQRTIIQFKLIRGYFGLPYTFFLNKNSTDIVKNIISEVDSFCGQSLIPLINIINNFVIILILSILLFKTDFLLMFLLFIVVFPTFFICYKLWQKSLELGKIQSESIKEIFLNLGHSLGSLKETKVMGCESYFENKLKNSAHNFQQAITSFEFYQIIPQFLMQIALFTSVIIFICIWNIFLQRDIAQMNATLGIFALSALRMLPAIAALLASINSLKNSTYGMEIIYFDLLKMNKSNTYKDKSIEETITLLKKIEINNINYRYPNRSDLVLKNIYFQVNKGESIAIIGKSGSGKTTLIDIILGILTPESGDIKVDGISIYNNLRSWQNILGYVPQSIFLMDDTLKNNIAFGVEEEDIDLDRVYHAIEMAQLNDVIAQLPDGIHTKVGERGVRLSGGQKQRIGIARVLYHQRQILVFDEATSALDNETEKSVTQAIQSLSGKFTMIIIAHRLTTITHCDRIYQINAETHTLQEVSQIQEDKVDLNQKSIPKV